MAQQRSAYVGIRSDMRHLPAKYCNYLSDDSSGCNFNLLLELRLYLLLGFIPSTPLLRTPEPRPFISFASTFMNWNNQKQQLILFATVKVLQILPPPLPEPHLIILEADQYTWYAGSDQLV